MKKKQKLCMFTTNGGNHCRCYKMKGENYCRSHIQYESSVDSETDIDMMYQYIIESLSESQDALEQSVRDIEKSITRITLQNIEAQQLYSVATKELYIVKNKLQQYDKNLKYVNIVQFIICFYLTFCMCYIQTTPDIQQVCVDIYNYIILYITYSIDMFIETQSFVKNYAFFDQNYRVLQIGLNHTI
jgi:hypothetical protein